MKNMSYYVVELSFRADNPIHRAICFHRAENVIELFGSYESVISKTVAQLAYFKVIEEIPAMTMPFENQYKLPRQVEE